MSKWIASAAFAFAAGELYVWASTLIS